MMAAPTESTLNEIPIITIWMSLHSAGKQAVFPYGVPKCDYTSAMICSLLQRDKGTSASR